MQRLLTAPAACCCSPAERLPCREQLLEYLRACTGSEAEVVASLAGIQSSVQYHSAADPQVALLQLALAGQAPVGYLKVLQQQEAEVLEVGQDKLAAAQDPDDDIIDEDPLVGAAVLQELLLAVVGSDALPSALQYVATQAQIGEGSRDAEAAVIGAKLVQRGECDDASGSMSFRQEWPA